MDLQKEIEKVVEGVNGDFGVAVKDLVTGESYQEGRFILGSPEECIERIAPFVEAGVDHMILRMDFVGIRQEDVKRSLRLFGEKVIPYFKEQKL